MFVNIEKRNADFVAAYRRVMRQARLGGELLTRTQALRRTLAQPAPRFYLQREHVWKKLSERRHTRPAHERAHRALMWAEIEQALDSRCASHPRESRWEALDYVLECYSPSSFFITESYGKRIILEYEARERAIARATSRFAGHRRPRIHLNPDHNH